MLLPRELINSKNKVSNIQRAILATAGSLLLVACSSGSNETDASASAEPSPFVDGCETYGVYSQNQAPPYGTAVRQEPNVLAPKTETKFAINEVIPVDGWTRNGQGPNYPVNGPPFNTDIWFHVAHSGGYVSFEGVRGTVTSPDTPITEENLLAELKPECEFQIDR